MNTTLLTKSNDVTAAEFLFVDAGVENSEILIDGLAPSTEVIRLLKDQAPLEQIAAAVTGRNDIGTVHILSHGEPGALALAGEQVDEACLKENASALDAIKSALSESAEIALWACSTAANATGQSFAKALEAATGARVFAADGPVGAAAKGGSWNIGTPAPFAPTAIAAYPHTLPMFDGVGGASNNEDYIETEGGVEMTATFTGDSAFTVASGGGGGAVGDLFGAAGFGTTSVTVTFDTAITISSFQYVELDGTASAGNYTFSVTTGDGTTVLLDETDFTNIAGTDGVTLTPIDWFNVTEITITSNAASWTPGLDTLVFNVNTTADLSIDNTTLAYVEGDAVTLIDSAGTVNDADGDGDWNTGTLVAQITANNDGANDEISISDTDGDGTTITISGTDILANGVDVGDLSVSGGTVTGGTALTITWDEDATNAIVQEVMQSIRYRSTSEDPSELDRTITFTATDGSGASNSDDRIVSVTANNDNPTVSGLVSDIALTEDTVGNIDLSASTFADVDTTGNVTVTLTASEGTFSTPVDGSTVGSGVTETLVNATTVTLVGTVTDINTYLNTASNIQYTGATDDNGADTSTITVTINDGEGSGNVAAGTINLDITAVNDDPTVTGLVTDIALTEDTAGDIDLSASAFADVDSAGNVTVTLTASEGTFSAPADGSGVGAGVTETLVNATTITLVGTVTDINSYLNTGTNISYTGATNDNGANTSTISVTLNDGDGSGDMALGTINLDITGVEDAPTVSGLTNRGAVEDVTGAPNFSGVTIADVDTAGNITVTVTATDTGAVLGAVDGAGVGAGVTETAAGNNVVTLVGSAADITTYLSNASAITYTSSANRETDDTISIQADDGISTPNAASTATIVMTPINDLPTGSDNTVTIDEDTTHTLTAANFGFSDVDSGDTFVSVRIDVQTLSSGTLQLSGTDVTDADVISVADINAGNLVYTPAADANGNGLLSFTFSVNDGTGFASSTSTLTVDVTDVSDNADPSTPILSNTSVAENAPGAVIGSVTSTDPDGDTVSFGTLGNDRFEVVDGVLKLRDGVSLDFEEEPTVRISIRAFDEFGGDTVKTYTITVEDVTELVGGDDDDVISGGDGDEDIEGGDGNDDVSAGDGRDTIDGGAGNDSVSGGGDDDFITGGAGQDTLFGDTGQDTLFGGAGDDEVFAGSGDDLIFAGLGDDGADTLSGDDGADTIGGGVGNDSINGGSDNDTIFGGADSDNLNGGGGDDLLFNGAGSDTVLGGTGNDTLWGGAGDDRLTGGAGADTFVFGATSGNDTVTDFDTSEDTLDLSFASAGFADLASVTAASSETNQDSTDGLLIDLGGGQSVFLIGLEVADLADLNLAL